MTCRISRTRGTSVPTTKRAAPLKQYQNPEGPFDNSIHAPVLPNSTIKFHTCRIFDRSGGDQFICSACSKVRQLFIASWYLRARGTARDPRQTPPPRFGTALTYAFLAQLPLHFRKGLTISRGPGRSSLILTTPSRLTIQPSWPSLTCRYHCFASGFGS